MPDLASLHRLPQLSKTGVSTSLRRLFAPNPVNEFYKKGCQEKTPPAIVHRLQLVPVLEHICISATPAARFFKGGLVAAGDPLPFGESLWSDCERIIEAR